MPALAKYLDQYAETESQLLTGFPSGFQQSLLIPVYRESVEDIQRFIRFSQQQASTLLVLVLNRPDTDLNTQWAQSLLTQTPFKQAPLWQSNDQALRCYSLNQSPFNKPSKKKPSAVLIVDRVLNGAAIPNKQGVGLARKIGADILCSLIVQAKVKSPWIANTDADAILPDDYFDALNTLNHHQKSAAAIFPFTAQLTNNIPHLPTLLYDFSLYYYVAGTAWAESPYSYHTIGSIMAVHYQHYAQVRGFPKRAAAEDFYLLNKLAKTGKITSLQQPVIKIIARHSNRVPFGTGPAVNKLANSENPLSMAIYHPDCFLYLKYFLQLQYQLCQKYSFTDELIVTSCQQLLTDSSPPIDTQLLLQAAKHFKLSAALNHCFKQGATAAARMQHLQHWFDGFKTLKFIHWVRDQTLGTITFHHWLQQHQDYALAITPPMQRLIDQIKKSSD